MPTCYLSAMTIHAFNQLAEEVQLAYVYCEGTYLARRWDDFHRAVNLYQMPDGFFAEVNYYTDTEETKFGFAFEAGSEEDRLPDYAMFVKLPAWVPDVE
jgi:predicted metal-dependent phosphotriesterase family hydrolase